MAASNPAAILECFRLSGVEKTGVTIGRGSYAQVIELRYRELICAGKELYPVPLPTDDLSLDRTLAVLERLKKECDMLSSVKHPNIVQFMGVYFDEGGPLPLLVMEYVPFTLSQHLEEHKPYPPEVSYGILVDVAKALCYLHGGKPVIIHRDLSANNVLLTHDMSAKVSDLGTAKRLSEKLSQHQTRCPGTLVYMPPEAYGEDSLYNETLDCFSYGILTLHIFSGEWPEGKDVFVHGRLSVGGQSEIDRRQKFVDKMGSDHPLMDLVESCLSVPGQRPSAKKILKRVSEVREKCCRQKTDKLSLLLLTDSSRVDKMEQTIAQLRSQQQNMEDQHLAEINKSANRIEEQLNDIEELKSFLEQLKRDRKVEEDRVQKKDKELACLQDKMEAEIDSIKRNAEEEMSSYKEKKDKEMKVKEQEINSYKEVLHEKEETLDKIIHKATERQQTYKLQRTTEMQIHPLHHKAKSFRWRQLPELPIGMTAPQCVCIDSSLYIGGGQTLNTDKELRRTIFEYNTKGNDGNSWKTTFPKCPTMHFGLGELDGKLVVVGGQKEIEEKEMIITGNVFVIDESKWWRDDIVPSMKIARMRSCVVSYKCCLAACGGMESKSSKNCSSAVELYRPETKTWYIIEPMPVRRAALRATVIHKTLYLLGGFCPDLTGVSERDCQSIELESLFRDDSTASRSWHSGIADTPYHSSAPGNICGSLLTVGGAFNLQNPTLTDAICAYSPVVNKWYHIGNLPIRLSSTTTVTPSTGELVVMGGRLGEKRNATVYIGSLE